MSNRIDELTNSLKLSELFNKTAEEERTKKRWTTVLAIIGCVALIAGICVAVYKFFFSSDKYDDFDDDEYYDDIFDDDSDN